MVRLFFEDRAGWRSWLKEHHTSESGIWLVYFKVHTKKKSIRYGEAVEEALCFGWIDSKVKKIDEERYMQWYSPRKDDSNWSESNKKRVEQLIEQGFMEPAGLEMIEIAKRNGSWDRLDDVDRDPTVPDDLAAALAENLKAKENFELFAPSYRKQYLWWLKSAKRPETRQKRIGEIVSRSEDNIKPGI